MSEFNNQSRDVSIGDWVVTMIVLAIPLVGFIMLFVWGFGGGTPKSKSNFCKATLIMSLIGIAISIVLMFAGVFAGIFASNWY